MSDMVAAAEVSGQRSIIISLVGLTSDGLSDPSLPPLPVPSRVGVVGARLPLCVWATYGQGGQQDPDRHQDGGGHGAALERVADAVVRAVEASPVRRHGRRLVQHESGQHDCAKHTTRRGVTVGSHSRQEHPKNLPVSAATTFQNTLGNIPEHTEQNTLPTKWNKNTTSWKTWNSTKNLHGVGLHEWQNTPEIKLKSKNSFCFLFRF